MNERAYFGIILGLLVAILYLYLKHRGAKIKYELVELNEKLIDIENALVQTIATVQESLDNHIIIKLTTVYINTIILNNTAAYSRMFLAYLKTIDMEQISKYYKILSTSKTFAEAYERSRKFCGNILSADITLLEHSFSYLVVKHQDKKESNIDTHGEFVLKSYPISFLDNLIEINNKIDGDLLHELQSYGTAKMEPPILKELVVGLYTRKLNLYQKEFLIMEPKLREDYTNPANLYKLLAEDDYIQLFERLTELDLEQSDYFQLIQVKGAYNSLLQRSLEYPPDFIETQKRRISAQLLTLIQSIDDYRKTTGTTVLPLKGGQQKQGI